MPPSVRVIAAAFLIGTAPNLARIGIDLGDGSLGPQGIVFWRFVFASVFLAGFLFWRDRRLPARPSPVLLLASACFALDLALWHWAIDYTTIANSSFLVSMGNLCLGLTAWLALGEKPARAWFVALPFAIGGAFLLSQGAADGWLGSGEAIGAKPGARLPDWRGDLLALGAAICASLYLLCSRIARDSFDGFATIFWLCVGGAATAALILLASGEPFWPSDRRSFIIPLTLALFVQVLGQGLLVSALGQMPSSRVVLLFLLQPLTAAALSVALFGEWPTLLQLAGTLAILFAIGFAGTWQGSRDANRQESEASP